MTMTKLAYWQEMKDKSAYKIADIAEKDVPETEHHVKELVAHVMRHGSCNDKAEVIVEAIEHMIACHMLKASTLPA